MEMLSNVKGRGNSSDAYNKFKRIQKNAPLQKKHRGWLVVDVNFFQNKTGIFWC